MSNRDDDRPLTVEEVLELKDGDWINGGLIGYCRSIQKKETKFGPLWECVVGSQTGRAELTLGVKEAPRFFPGALIQAAGKGIKVKIYRGSHEVSMGKNAFVQVVTAAPEDSPKPASRPTAERSEIPPASGPGHIYTDGNAAAQAALAMIPGQTVGHAMTHALELVKEAHTQRVADQSVVMLGDVLKRPDFWNDVMNVASDIIRISNALQKGKIRPTLRDRLNPPKEEVAPPPPPPPPPKPVPAVSKQNDDEDVPF